MANMIVNSEVIYMAPWQIEAAANTQLSLWPPVPNFTERPYLSSFYIPLEVAGGRPELEDVGGPEVGNDVIAIEGGQGGQPYYLFQVMKKKIVAVTEIEDKEAILMGLVAITKYARGSGKALIKDAWDGMVNDPALKFDADPAPLALYLSLKRVA